jgi:hypothetical protein
MRMVAWMGGILFVAVLLYFVLLFVMSYRAQ